MQLKAKTKIFKLVVKQTKTKNRVLVNAAEWSNDEHVNQIQAEDFEREELEAIREAAQSFKVENSARLLIRKINTYLKLTDAPTGTKVNRLEGLVVAAKNYIAKTTNRWLFVDEEDGSVLPYFVEDIEYHPKQVTAHGTYPPYVTFDLYAYMRGKRQYLKKSFHGSDIGDTVDIILQNAGLFLENEDALAQHAQEVKQYKAIVARLGAQMHARGTAYYEDNSSWYSSGQGLIAMEREGRATKVVVDDNAEDDEDKKESRRRGRNNENEDDTISNEFWKSFDKAALAKQEEELGDDYDEDEFNKVLLPIHPYVRVFDLDKHEYVEIHVQHLSEYPFDKTLMDKLVLPKEKKDLISILVAGANDAKEDIVAGKMSGVIVLATGEPGTGKTLTAEVFSEEIERPLYVVQCSQLGTDLSSIETNLEKTLRRAARWQAILLIDEADVYIHERGNDMEQNAIVGVFLRVLEYHRGVLFMTSNRGDIVDDAIMSRATAWIQYERPFEDELRRIWAVLSAQYDIKLAKKDVDVMMSKFPRMAGREVRNILKLARLLSKRTNKKVDADMLLYVSDFQQLKGAVVQKNRAERLQDARP
jgi:AAA+ superfamily predicted ATPase